MGIEDQLVPELVDLVVRGKQSPDRTKYMGDHNPKGSANWPMLSAAAEYWKRPDAVAGWWLEEFRVQHTRFMQTELLSRIYIDWFVVPVMCVYVAAKRAGHTGLSEEARTWLRTLWTVCTLGAGGNPTLPVSTNTGSRSWAVRDGGEPHHIHDQPINYMLRAALGFQVAGYRSGDFCDPIIRALGDNPFGLTSAEQDVLFNTLMTGHLNTALSYLSAFRTNKKYMLTRTSTHDSATVLTEFATSVSTPTLPVLIYRSATGRLDPVCPLRPGGPGGNHSVTRAYGEYDGNKFKAVGSDGSSETAPGLTGSPLWEVYWGGSSQPPPPPPLPPPPGEDPPQWDGLDPILIHAYDTVALPEEGDSLATAIQRAINKARQIELVRTTQTSNPGDPILVHSRATQALPEPGDDDATTLQRAKNKATQVVLVREAELGK